MARYGKTNEQRIKDRERRDDIKEILNFLKYHADEMNLPTEIRELVRDRLQTSHKMQKSEQTILRERWNQYVDDQCYALLARLAGTGFHPVCDIVQLLPFEMTPQQFGLRMLGSGYGTSSFRYHNRTFVVERTEMHATREIKFNDKPLQIPCTRVAYQVR